MKVLLQRVSSASVEVNAQMVGQIDRGLLLFAGFGEADRSDVDHKIQKASNKLLNLRVFSNPENKLDYSVIDIGGGVLAVPQFTLYGKSLKGRRPDFTDALEPDFASRAFDHFHSTLARNLGKEVATGVFGADMQVSLVNDGPLTLMFEF
ncbi:MAG: D-aminoacyl-tRNA deacylase [Arenicellales bacterium]